MIVDAEKLKVLKGRTEVYFKDFVAVEPSIVKVRDGYRANKNEKDVVEKVTLWCERHFGQSRFNRDWAELFGTDQSDVPNATERWDAWIASKPLGYRKLYYDPRVVAACIMGEDE
jgi:hypothetical protein